MYCKVLWNLPIFAMPNNRQNVRNMNIDNLKSQMRKGMLEFCVLLILKRGDAYASEMIARLKEAHLIVMEVKVYPLLTRLKKDGILSYRWEESTQGPPRKYYSITPVGHQFLEQLQQSWDEIASAVTILQLDYNNKYLPQ